MKNPERPQIILETIITFFYDFFHGILGEKRKRYIPYLITNILYIGLANIMGIFGFKPPTKDLNVTIALSVIPIVT